MTPTVTKSSSQCFQICTVQYTHRAPGNVQYSAKGTAHQTTPGDVFVTQACDLVIIIGAAY